MAQPGLALVPNGLGDATIMDVGLKVEDGGQVEEDQGDHKVLVDAKAIALEGPRNSNIKFCKRKKIHLYWKLSNLHTRE